MSEILVTQSLYTGVDYYLFRPLGNDQYFEVPFKIVNHKIIENLNHKLKKEEKNYILDNILSQN